MIDVHYVALFTSSITSYGINKAPKYAQHRIEVTASPFCPSRFIKANREYLITYVVCAVISFLSPISRVTLHSTTSLN